MKQWWQNLQTREQQLVLVMLPFVVIFMFYQLIWSPLNEAIAAADKKLSRQQELATWVNTETARLKASTGGQAKGWTGSLSSAINRSARQRNITISRVQPQGSDVQVWIDNIEFNRLLDWFSVLANEQGIYVKSVDLTQGNAAGEVVVKRLQLGS
ncbi:type II secretion system protein GspM [Thalassotalea marina]|uniref:Type II secretion system protein M n=1 Tax=Thalassotalea marina TaxID=1673741 RepID=A0A919BQ06_9GAMM|nr:type II secretion system protein M [Thalassotalea marina]GHG03946.1 type II secretion system protein M [Thalassotalea marina]